LLLLLNDGCWLLGSSAALLMLPGRAGPDQAGPFGSMAAAAADCGGARCVVQLVVRIFAAPAARCLKAYRPVQRATRAAAARC
jgi:hypothetical protein